MKNVNFMKYVSIFLTIVLFACSDEEENENRIKDGYFTIENAFFVDKTQPEGETGLIQEMSVNRTAINGGSTIISFSVPVELQTAYIGVKGVRGYYEYSVAGMLAGTSGKYTYDIVLSMNQVIKAEEFSICLSVVSKEGVLSSIITSEDIRILEVGTGELQVSLSWDQLDDVDLHLFDPDGNHIYYGNPYIGDEISYEEEFIFECYLVNKYTGFDTSGLSYEKEEDWDLLYEYLSSVDYDEANYSLEYYAYFKDKIEVVLDLDSNPACNIDGVNNENITYNTTPKDGTYTVAIDLYQKCNWSEAGAKYSVTVNYQGKPVTVSDKQVGQFADNYNGSWDTPDKYVVIGTFTIGSEELRSAYSPKAPHPGREKIRQLMFRKK